MRYKLIDFIPGRVEEYEVRPCKLGFGTTFSTDDIFVLKNEYGEEYEIENCEWDWGIPKEIEISNIVDFATWLENRDIEDAMNFDTLYDLAEEYRSSLEDKERK